MKRLKRLGEEDSCLWLADEVEKAKDQVVRGNFVASKMVPGREGGLKMTTSSGLIAACGAAN